MLVSLLVFPSSHIKNDQLPECLLGDEKSNHRESQNRRPDPDLRRFEKVESRLIVPFFLGEILLIFDRVLTLASKVEFELSSARNILTLSGRAPKLPLFCSILRC